MSSLAIITRQFFASGSVVGSNEGGGATVSADYGAGPETRLFAPGDDVGAGDAVVHSATPFCPMGAKESVSVEAAVWSRTRRPQSGQARCTIFRTALGGAHANQ